MMATKRFYSSKFYPVNYDTKTIYNDPQRRAGDCDLNSVTYRDKGTVGIRGFRLNNFEQTYSTFTLVDVADKAIYREADAKRAVDNYEREFADDSRRGTTAALSGKHSSPVGIDDPDDRVYDLAADGDSITSTALFTAIDGHDAELAAFDNPADMAVFLRNPGISGQLWVCIPGQADMPAARWLAAYTMFEPFITPVEQVSDLTFDLHGDALVSDPLPPESDDLFIDRLITVTDRDTLAFTDRLTGDGTAVVAHLYDTISQQWAAAVIPLDFVGFLPGVTLEQENAWVASLRSMATVGEVV